MSDIHYPNTLTQGRQNKEGILSQGHKGKTATDNFGTLTSVLPGCIKNQNRKKKSLHRDHKITLAHG